MHLKCAGTMVSKRENNVTSRQGVHLCQTLQSHTHGYDALTMGVHRGASVPSSGQNEKRFIFSADPSLGKQTPRALWMAALNQNPENYVSLPLNVKTKEKIVSHLLDKTMWSALVHMYFW